MSKKQEVVLVGAVEQTVAARHDDETQMIATRLSKLKAETTFDLPVENGQPMSGDTLRAWVLIKEEEATRAAVERGIGYMLVKREIGHGAFEGWLKDFGIHPRMAQRAMKTAQLLMSLSDSNATRASLLPQRKLDVLVSLPAVALDDLFDEGALDNADQMSRNQLQEIVQLRKQLDSEMKKSDRLSDRVAEMDEDARARRALPEQALYIKELRRAVLEETEALRVNAHTLQEVMDKVALLPRDTRPADIDAIIHPLMYSLQGLHATVQALYDRGFDEYAQFKPDVDVLPPELEDAEVDRAKRLAAQFSNDAQMRAWLRQVDLAPVPAPRKGKGAK